MKMPTKKSVIIFASLIILIGLFVALSPKGTIKMPTNKSNDSDTVNIPGAWDVKSISDENMKKTVVNKSVVAKPKKTPKPLPYPRIVVNYSMQRAKSIGSNTLDRNSTFVIVTLDIRNYGYKYFDAHPNKFRIGKSGELIPVINVSTGKIIDAVIPNSSRARGDLIFLLGKKVGQGKLIYSSANKSESYYIIYKKMSASQMDTIKKDVSDNLDRSND